LDEFGSPRISASLRRLAHLRRGRQLALLACRGIADWRSPGAVIFDTAGARSNPFRHLPVQKEHGIVDRNQRPVRSRISYDTAHHLFPPFASRYLIFNHAAKSRLMHG
jgi:hypothetical protein